MRPLRGGGDSAAAPAGVPGHGKEGPACESEEAPAWRQGRGRDRARAGPGLVLRVLLARGQPTALVARTEEHAVSYAKSGRKCREDHGVRRAPGWVGCVLPAAVVQPPSV